MNSFNVVIPTGIHRVTVRRRTMPESSQSGEVKEELLYDGGFAAGYEAGQWKAQKEAQEIRERQAKEVNQVLQGLQAIQAELLIQARQNFPPLLLSTIERVFKNYRMSEEEMGKEIAAFLGEVAHAQSVSIECSPEELELLQKTLEKLGVSLQKGVHNWKANPTLKRGEFILETDLGSVDGRKITKLNKIKASLQTS